MKNAIIASLRSFIGSSQLVLTGLVLTSIFALVACEENQSGGPADSPSGEVSSRTAMNPDQGTSDKPTQSDDKNSTSTGSQVGSDQTHDDDSSKGDDTDQGGSDDYAQRRITQQVREKMDSALIAAIQQSRGEPPFDKATLESLGVKVLPDGTVKIEITATSDNQVGAFLRAKGATDVTVSPYGPYGGTAAISATAPLTCLEDLALRKDVRFVDRGIPSTHG